jgi:hypothetical protein
LRASFKASLFPSAKLSSSAKRCALAHFNIQINIKTAITCLLRQVLLPIIVCTLHFDIGLDITPCFQLLQPISKSISKWKVHTIIGNKTYLKKQAISILILIYISVGKSEALHAALARKHGVIFLGGTESKA